MTHTAPLSPKRCLLVGTGGRANMYLRYLSKEGRDLGHSLVGLCDINPGRMAYYQQHIQEKWNGPALPCAGPDDFETLIRDSAATCVIVTTIDRTHADFICRAMRAGCEVITEKPMTVDAESCRRILRTQAETGQHISVTFNYRYAPRHSRVKELLQSGAIGEIYSVHFEWLLDTSHGADYFRRWHRDKRNSGGLMVHKSTHHFDLVNWWIGSTPESVFAMGDLRFYGRANAEKRGLRQFYVLGTQDPGAAGDPFALDMSADKKATLKALYLDQEHHDGYRRDQSVFSDGISIEDDMSVLVRFQNQATMTYHLTAYSPWEGYRVMFNGSKGRLEYEVQENTYVSGSANDHHFDVNVSGGVPYEVKEPASLILRPHWRPPIQMDIQETSEGGHGGGDIRMLRDIFGEKQPDPLARAAGVRDGAWSILTGIAANESMRTGQLIKVSDLVNLT